MIVLERKKPKELFYYEVMKRRALQPAEFSAKYAQSKAGYDGELRFDREWKDASINGLFFRNFTCFNQVGYRHQMDTIFICKHFVFVAEVKNITGRIFMNPKTRQLVQQTENKPVAAFQSPIDQVKRHRQLLQDHFVSLPEFVPVEAAVVITNPYCVIEHVDDELPVFIVTGLRSIIAEMIKRHQHIHLNVRAIRASLESLYRTFTDEPWRKDVALQYGILCTQCNTKMLSTTRGFKCLRCQQLDHNDLAIRTALYDYSIIHGPEITNRQFRDFTEIKSPSTAYGILNRLLPTRKGAKRNSTYLIPDNILKIRE